MKRLDLKVGFSCNNRCRFCAQGHRRNLGDNTTQECKENLKEGYENGAREVVFTGGEPTIRDDILELVSYAKTLGFERIQIQTNARRLSYLHFCKGIVKAGANEFSPAIHGPNAKIHEACTRAKGSFEQTYQAIKNLKSLDQYVISNTVINKINYKYLPEIVEMLMNLEVDQFQLAFVHPCGWAKENFEEVVPRKTAAQPYIHKALDVAENHPHEIINMMVEAYPYCFMQGYEKYVSQLYIPQSEIRGQESVVADHEKVRKDVDKVKFPQCKECKYFLICEGPWKEYPEKYGNEEFKPIKGKRIKNKSEIIEEGGKC